MRNPSVGEKLALALETIRSTPRLALTKGDSVDRTFAAGIASALGAKAVITPAVWKDSDEWSELRMTVSREARGDGNGLTLLFPGLEAPFSSPMVVSQPNGSQQWPDAIVIHMRRAMAIEFKSADQDRILWNSGLPRKGGVYVFNGSPGLRAAAAAGKDGASLSSTTFFLGEHVLDDETRDWLRVAALANQEDAEKVNAMLAKVGSPWNLYARPMFNNRRPTLSDPERAARETGTLEFVRTFNWNP